jgi:hypothetical protein
VVRVGARPDPEAYLSSYLKSHWSRDFTIPAGGVESPDAYTRKVHVDLNRLDMIIDEATNGRIFVGTRLKDVAEFTASLREKEWVMTGTSLHDALARAGDRSSALVTTSETALVHAAHAQLVQVPAVQMAMSPLRNILVRLDGTGRLSLAELRRSRKSPEQVDKYVEVLRGVDYLRVEKDDLVPGPAFPKGTRDEPAVETYDKMLAKVVTQSMAYLRFVLGFSQIVGYLRWANSLYLTAWFADREGLAMTAADLESKYNRYYGGLHRSGIEITGQIQRVVDAKVIDRRGELISGNAEITPRFFEEARGIMPTA